MYLRPFALPQCAPHVVMGYCLCQDRKSQEDKGMNDLYCPCWSLRLTRGAPLLIAFPSHPPTYSPTTTCTLTKQLGATTMTMYCDMHVHRTMLPLKTGMPEDSKRKTACSGTMRCSSPHSNVCGPHATANDTRIGIGVLDQVRDFLARPACYAAIEVQANCWTPCS